MVIEHCRKSGEKTLDHREARDALNIDPRKAEERRHVKEQREHDDSAADPKQAGKKSD
jgi:hypothetical protein